MPRVPVELTSEKEGEFIQDKEAVHPSIGQYFYTPQEIQKLANDPEYLLNYRKRIEYAINEGFAIFYKGSEASEMAHKYMVAEMNRRLKNDPILTQKLIPSWPVGCRYAIPTKSNYHCGNTAYAFLGGLPRETDTLRRLSSPTCNATFWKSARLWVQGLSPETARPTS